RGDQRPALDREFVAYLAGLSRADKLPPFLEELQEIGFLSIFDGGPDPTTGRRRQRRDKSGRPVFDHFAITLEPPDGYVGPRNLTEVHAQFVADRDAAYREAVAANKKPRVGRQTIRRTEVGYVDESQVSTVPGFRGQDSPAVPGFRGQQEFPQVSPVPGFRGQDSPAVPGFRGQQEFPQVSTVPGFRGPVLDSIDSSPRRRGEESIEPVAGGTAEPPATGQ